MANDFKFSTEELFDCVEGATKVAVAVSGGADSMCLLHIVWQWAKQHKKDIVALIVEHGLRAESATEAVEVHNFLTRQGIEVYILPWIGEKPKKNIQSIARKERYKLLLEYCNVNSIKYLFVAHTLDDQAETILMRIIRGSGIKGISGIRKQSYRQGICILRPLLERRRNEIEAYLREISWPWVEDPSNRNCHYDRIKARHILHNYAEYFSDNLIYSRLALLAKNAARANDYLASRVNWVYKHKVINRTEDLIVIDNSVYRLHNELLYSFFADALKSLVVKDEPFLKLQSLEYMLERLRGSAKVKYEVLGCIILKNETETTIARANKERTDKE